MVKRGEEDMQKQAGVHVSMTQVREGWVDYVNRAQDGEVFILTRNSRQVAALVPVELLMRLVTPHNNCGVKEGEESEGENG
jgi:prevent-host-death family protein